MNPLLRSWLKLFRVRNLLLVALTQLILYLLILRPPFQQAGLSPQLNLPQLFLLIFTTVIIAAAGYLINDYYDQEIDLINKPNKQIIGLHIPPFRVLVIYQGLFLFGLALSVYLAWQVQAWGLLWLYPGAFFLLWAYARYLKKLPLLGNGIVALFCAGVAGILWVAERQSLEQLQAVQPDLFDRSWKIMSAYLFFAFVSTMYREIIKDLEDERGDRMGNCRTLPIWLGPIPAKAIAGVFALSLVAGLFFFLKNPVFQVNGIHWILAGLLIFVPVCFSLIQLIRAHSPAQYHRLSTLGKWIMVSGLLFVLLIW